MMFKSILETGVLSEAIGYTGQHSNNMNAVFFDQFNVLKPNHQLTISIGSHGNMTGRMLIEIEKILLKEQSDCVLLYGDTDFTAAGALAASKLHVPVGYVEAGLRNFNIPIPEEINRVLTDRISNILFCPTQASVNNLQQEGYPFITANGKAQRIEQVDDEMQNSATLFANRGVKPEGFKVGDGFIISTSHRVENTDDASRLTSILAALNDATQHTLDQSECVELLDASVATLVDTDAETVKDVISHNLGREEQDERLLCASGMVAQRIAELLETAL